MSAAELLKVEESVKRLMHELEALQREADGYSHAQVHLEHAAAAVGGVASRLTDVAAGMRDAMDAIRSLSMPVVIERLDAFKADLQRLEDGIDARFGAVRKEQAEQLMDTMVDVRKQILAASEEAARRNEVLQRSGADALSSLVATGAQNADAKAKELSSAFEALEAKFQASRKAMDAGLKRLRSLIGVLAVLVVVVIVLAVANLIS